MTAARAPKSVSHNRKPRPDGPVWLYGRHAVAAALANPARRIRRLVATKNAADWLAARTQENGPPPHEPEDMKPDAIDRLLPAGAVHQGLAAEVDPLPRARLKDVCGGDGSDRIAIVLDQVTDPQNIGAVLRSAAAMGAAAMIVQDRRTPPFAGALAKAAAGAVELVPCVRVVNISRALEALQDLGFHCAGLAGDAPASIDAFPRDRPLAIVMGAEGTGLREKVAETCDGLYGVPIAPAIESLNVSAAAAIALYEAARKP